MRIRRRVRFVVAAGLGLSLSAAAPATAVTAVGGGSVRGFKGVQVVGLPDTACTASFPFEAMPGMSVKLDLKRRGPIVVMFQGQFGGGTSTPASRTALRIVVDGTVVGSALAVGNDTGTGLETFGFNSFSTTPLGAGSHTVTVLWHTFPAGATSCVEERSLIVLHP
jgi:hypothetical protein